MVDGNDLHIGPLSTFPIIRDLIVDRSKMFDALEKVKAWVPLDGTHDIHRHAPLISPDEQSIRYIFSRCMTCGCCMEVCPQFHAKNAFIGPAPIGQAWLFSNHPTGRYYKEERLHALMGVGGITDCGNAQNCIQACPKDIKLTDAIAKVGRDSTVQMLKDLFLK